MIKMKKIVIIFSAVLIFSACDYSLDETIYSEIDAAKYELGASDLDATLAPVYSSIGTMIKTWHGVVFDEGNDYMQLCSNGSGWYDGGVYNRMHLHTWPDNQSHMWRRWRDFNTGVFRANNALFLIESGEVPVDENLKPNIIAQIKAVRAYFNWQLMDYFGRVPLVLDFSGELLAQSERVDIYNHLVQELEQIIPELSTDVNLSTYGKMNQWAARTLLANIYLNAEVYTGTSQWDKCIEQCDAVINSGKYTLAANYKDNFIVNNQNSPEIILAIPCDFIYGVGINFWRACLHAASKAKYNSVVTAWGTGSVKGTPQFLDMYEEGDKRLADCWDFGPQISSSGEPILGGYDVIGKPMTFTKPLPDGLTNGESQGYRLNVYDPTGGNGRLDNDIILFRYAQVLMMKAECLLRTGKADEAAAIVTQVRMRSFDDPVDAAISGTELAGPTTYRYGKYVVDYGLDYAQIIEAMQRGDDEYIASKITELNIGQGLSIDNMDQQVADMKAQLAGKSVSEYFIDDDVSDIQYGRMLDEWGKEVLYEFTRRRDLIRFNVYTTKSWLTHVPNGDYRKIFPIPLNAISTNSLLQQNEGYY